MPNGLVFKRRIKSLVVFESAARTAAPDDVDIDTTEAFGLVLTLHCSADPAAAAVTVTAYAVDPVSGEETSLLASAALDTADETQRLVIYPGAATTANVSANAALGEKVRIKAAHADSDSITYSVGAQLLPF